MFMRLTLLALITLNLSLLPLAHAQTVPTAEGASLEGLVGQLLGGSPVTLYVADVPEGLLEHVPMPDWLRYYGAMVGSQESTVILSLGPEHAHMDFEEAIMAYDALLEGGGWTGVPTARQEPVFLLPNTLYDSRLRPDVYCHEGSGRALQLSPVVEQSALVSLQGEFSGLRLHLDNPFAQHLCRGEEQPFSVHPLPTLVLPEGVRLQGSSSGMGGSYAEASVSFTTHVSREAMLEHLAAQLVEVGWERQEEASLGAHLLLAFMLEEEGQTWQALLTVTGNDESAYAVTLRADTRPEPPSVGRQEALSVDYLQHALVLSSPQGAAVVAFTPEVEDGASYRYRLLRQGSQEEETGEGSIFEKYLREPAPGGGYRLTDAGSSLIVTAGPLEVEWSWQHAGAGWIYHQDAGVTATVVDLELFETLELRDYLP